METYLLHSLFALFGSTERHNLLTLAAKFKQEASEVSFQNRRQLVSCFDLVVAGCVDTKAAEQNVLEAQSFNQASD